MAFLVQQLKEIFVFLHFFVLGLEQALLGKAFRADPGFASVGKLLWQARQADVDRTASDWLPAAVANY